MLKIAVCEDEKRQRDELVYYLQKYAQLNCCELELHYSDSVAAFWANYDPAIKVAFLDIYLQDGMGIDIAARLREMQAKCAIVFVTSSTEHAVKGFELNVQHYLTKPIGEEPLFEALKRCEQAFSEDLRHLEIANGRLTVPIRLKDIIYIEVFNKVSILHTVTDDVKTYMPLAQLEKELGGDPFLRCHRCSIVNMNYVQDYSNDAFLMSNGDQVAIRRTGKVDIRQHYLDFIFMKVRGHSLA